MTPNHAVTADTEPRWNCGDGRILRTAPTSGICMLDHHLIKEHTFCSHRCDVVVTTDRACYQAMKLQGPKSGATRPLPHLSARRLAVERSERQSHRDPLIMPTICGHVREDIFDSFGVELNWSIAMRVLRLWRRWPQKSKHAINPHLGSRLHLAEIEVA